MSAREALASPASSSGAAANEAIVVLCAVPSEFDAHALGTDLVQRSLAACVQIGPSVTSIYRWQGATENTIEKLILIKTRRELFEGVAAAIRAVHPYEVPEIIGLDVSAAHVPYLNWIAEMTTG